MNKVFYFHVATFVSVFFNFFSFYLISKLYVPNEYGEYLYEFSIATIFATVMTLKFELSITDAKSDATAFSEAIITLVVSLLILGVIILLLILFGNVDLNQYIIIFPILIVLYVIVQQLFIYLNHHIYNGLLVASVSIINAFCVLVSNHIKSSLFFANIISYSIPILVALIYLGRYYYKAQKECVINFNLIQKRKYLITAYPLGILSVISQTLNSFIIRIFFGPIALGTFGVVNKIFSIPSMSFGLVQSGIARYEFSQIKEAESKDSEIKKFFNLASVSSLIAFPILVLLIYIFSKSTNLFIKYNDVFLIAMSFVLCSAVQFIINQLCVVFLAVNLIREYVIIMTAQVVLIATPLIMASFLNISFYSYLLVQSVTFILLYLGIFRYVHKMRF